MKTILTLAVSVCLLIPNLCLGQPGSMKWQFTYGDGITTTPALAKDGTIYVAANGALIALNPSGSQVWALALPGLIWGSPSVAEDGTIYVGASFTNLLYAVNTNGSLRWQTNVPGVLMLPPSLAEDGTILIPAADDPWTNSSCVALNTNGDIQWQFHAGGRPTGAAIGYDGTIYIGSSDTNGFFALHPDGTIKWSFQPIVNPQGGTAAIASDGTVYIASIFDLKLHALRPDGTLRWECLADASLVGGPAIAEDGTVYFTTVWDGKLHAVNADGTTNWSYAVGDITYTAPAVSKHGTIYTSANDKRVIALNSDGTRKWEFVTGSQDINPVEGRRPNPVIAPDGTIYFPVTLTNGQGVLYAIEGDSGPAESPWPMFHRDAQHTARVPFVITNQPANQVVSAGSNVVFEVGVASTRPCVFQWRYNGANMPDQTNAVLLLANAGSANEGSYSCLVSNTSGGFVSRAASLTVHVPPLITDQPHGTVGYWGATAQFSVSVEGTPPFSFLWHKESFPIPWATNAILTLTNLEFANAGNYWVAVTNICGSTNSASALLVVNPAGVWLGMHPFLTITGTVGKTFGIEYTTQVSQTNSWTPLTNFTLTEPVQEWIDTSVNAVVTPQRFYRVVPIP